MKSKLSALRANFHEELREAKSAAEVDALDVKFLGRKGPIQDLMKSLRDCSAEERPEMGKLINDLKEEIASTLKTRQEDLHTQEENRRLASETIDVTLPGRRPFRGGKHLITQMMDRVVDILVEMGFSVQYGPEIDTNYYNFEALNFTPDHPAMDMQDTFYIAPQVLLRTHTSNIQARFMESHTPPIRIIAPGRSYRNEDVSQRSHVFFHQVEGLYVDKNVTFADLLATFEQFLHRLLGPTAKVRFRPSYFPFVEPGLEIDVSCMLCQGAGCAVCKETGWLEIAGAGMVHPNVLQNVGIDPEVYSGFAWGMGLERLTMLLYGIPDIRMFTQNDMRFLNQFA